jgi:hypothetical protein
MWSLSALLMLFLLITTGCETPAPPPTQPQQPSPAAQPPAPATAPTPPPPAPDAAQQQPQKPTVETKAAVGVGKRGRGYGKGYVATPIGTLFAAQEKITFLMIEDAMNKFKALEGRPPKDHEEFMERIIKENMIKLPELPDGHRYRYDPKTAQLMVEQPIEE